MSDIAKNIEQADETIRQAQHEAIRWLIECDEVYTTKGRDSAPEVTVFGDYWLVSKHRPASDFLAGSAEHREKRIRAILYWFDRRHEEASRP